MARSAQRIEDDESTMHVAVYRGEGRVPVESFPIPALNDPHDVLVEIAYCGICGTDLHAIVEELGIFGWGAPGFIGGHEWSGQVVATGEGVTSWKVGDRVTASSGECGSCPACRSGRPSICRVRRPDDGQGGWSQYMRMREELPRGAPRRARPAGRRVGGALRGRPPRRVPEHSRRPVRACWSRAPGRSAR